VSAAPPVFPVNLRIADVIEATGEAFEIPPLVRASSELGVHWCSCTFCDWSGWSDECLPDGSVAQQGACCPECYGFVEAAE
jgi:hypothetical protein